MHVAFSNRIYILYSLFFFLFKRFAFYFCCKFIKVHFMRRLHDSARGEGIFIYCMTKLVLQAEVVQKASMGPEVWNWSMLPIFRKMSMVILCVCTLWKAMLGVNLHEPCNAINMIWKTSSNISSYILFSMSSLSYLSKVIKVNRKSYIFISYRYFL